MTGKILVYLKLNSRILFLGKEGCNDKNLDKNFLFAYLRGLQNLLFRGITNEFMSLGSDYT